jgi:hypothetical protein
MKEVIGINESPSEICQNRIDDDNDGLIDSHDPDCRLPGDKFRFELSSCQVRFEILACDAKQTSPSPSTYDRISCNPISQRPVFCFLDRIDEGSSDPAEYFIPSNLETAVYFQNRWFVCSE